MHKISLRKMSQMFATKDGKWSRAQAAYRQANIELGAQRMGSGHVLLVPARLGSQAPASSTEAWAVTSWATSCREEGKCIGVGLLLKQEKKKKKKEACSPMLMHTNF